MPRLFVSDLHIGSPICNAEALCGFLASYEARDKIYLIGDIFDDVTYKYLPSLHIEAVELLLSFSDIIWMPGNHDHFVRIMFGLFTDRLKVFSEGSYRSPFTGKQYLLTHGDRYDPTLWLTPPRFIRKLIPKHAPSGLHGKLVGDFMKRRAIRDAKKFGYDGVICGHSHVPDHDVVGDIEYVNCGDWTEHASAVIEDENGLRLIAYEKKPMEVGNEEYPLG